MPLSEARKRANQKWNDANMMTKYDHIHLTVPKGDRAKIQAAAKAAGEKTNAYINRAIAERMEKEGR